MENNAEKFANYMTTDKVPPVDSGANQYLDKAKLLVRVDHNTKLLREDPQATLTRDQDYYIVWFAKVLGNWKALISTDVVARHYWEVTYNGEKREAYVDCYVKASNQLYKDKTTSMG